jgi:AcrR family transcriptional regulator
VTTETSTKDRILFAGAELYRRKGFTGTGLKAVAAQADAAFGSLYHHYPGGKEQLGEAVIRTSGAFFLQLFVVIADDAPDVVTAVERFFAGAAQTLVATDWEDACPIAVIALEVASTNETLRLATADVFESWLAEGRARFAAAGIPEAPARALALSFVCGLEGAFLLCRATRSTEPMEAAGAAAAADVRRALDRSGNRIAEGSGDGPS